MGTDADSGIRRVRDGAGVSCAADGRSYGFQLPVPARHRFPPANAVPRRLLARPHAFVPRADAEGQRIPARHAPMDLGRGHRMGGDGADARVA